MKKHEIEYKYDKIKFKQKFNDGYVYTFQPSTGCKKLKLAILAKGNYKSRGQQKQNNPFLNTNNLQMVNNNNMIDGYRINQPSQSLHRGCSYARTWIDILLNAFSFYVL